MLRLSKKADYALMAMKHLAQRDGGSSSCAREIAEQYDIPIELMAKVLQRLVRMGLVTRSRSETSNREVVVALSPKGRALKRRRITADSPTARGLVRRLRAPEMAPRNGWPW